ncbi:OmpP1/FadL family transporter [Thiohalophilus sp.]|uniref:OmpP1/FadL family transporter n=1 Tax=Thiohalophilus sp. TaxID=3028392 RepID=UPI002ACD7A67|nr:outer membrane protein transport protein [Thiohalophilus sp.]MDZ7663437.1 outer membrane protein transport protein [Thiohalophilus sp.]
MKKTNKRLLATAVAAALALPTAAFATNGYFAHGYGTKNKGLGGAGVALPQDSLAAATNPAGMVWVGDRMDLGAAIFSPQREYKVEGAANDGFPAFELQPGTVESDSEYFLIPHFGRNWMLDANSAVGVSVYGNGGMNTDYPDSANGGAGTYYGGMFGGEAGAGVNLEQLFVNTSYSRKIDDKSSWGASAILAYQRFEATGLEGFGPAGFNASSDPDNLTDNGVDSAMGYGFKLGYQGEVAPNLTLAASYQSEMEMGEFDDYAGLFAEQGGFNIPATWTLGLAYDMADSGTVVFDVQKIMYSDINSIGNPMLPNLQTAQLGDDDGAGFGWEDITVYKLGYQWSTSADYTWRVGYNHGDQPIPDSEVLFNILAPGVMEDHFTFGMTKKTGADSEFNLAAMYAPSNSVKGDNPLQGPTAPNQTIELEMTQWELEASWAWKF